MLVLSSPFPFIFFIFSFSMCCWFIVNKQLNDKERVAAALENSHLLNVVDQCLARTLGEK